MEKMIIVEGPQGAGKSTLAGYLRDNIAGSNLYRLSGQRDKTSKGLNYSIQMYEALFEYLDKMSNIPMSMIFDRTYTTEEVYARLGYKDYSFTNYYERYNRLLERLQYEVYYFSLYLKDVELYRQRLARPEHHQYQAFSLDNSVNQQNTYLNISEEMDKLSNVNVIQLPMDNFEESYDVVRKTLKMK